MHNNNHILLDITKVAGATIAAATITISDVNAALTTVSICLAIFYTGWKWVKDIKKDKNNG